MLADNRRLGALIGDALRVHGFVVDWVRTGEDAEAALATAAYDAVILDLGLPDRDGMTLLPSRGGGRPGCPILVLTARDSTEALIDALDGGADDDYLRKRRWAAWSWSNSSGTSRTSCTCCSPS